MPIGTLFAQRRAGPPRVALLVGETRQTEPGTARDFLDELRALGYTESRDVVVDIVEMDGRTELLPKLLQDIVRSEPAVIVVSGSQAVRAARAATSSIPIVAISLGDPVEQKLADALARPIANVTGNALIQEVSDEKSVEIARTLVAGAARVGVLVNPKNPIAERTRTRYRAAASRQGVEILFAEAGNAEAIASALAALAGRRVDVLIVSNDQLFRIRRKTIVDELARHRVPAVYPLQIYVEAGGLVSYGYDRSRLARNAAAFVDRILKGAKPADLPFEQPTHYELVINLNTAKALGLAIPQTLLVRANRTIPER